jgi:hypothetical protein
MPAGSLGEIDLGYVAGDDFEWAESAAFARGRFYAARTDFALIGTVFRENVMAGVDAARAVGGAGTWLEAAYVWAGENESSPGQPAEEDYLRLSTGADYNFGSGVYVFAEYHYNGAGESDPARGTSRTCLTARLPISTGPCTCLAGTTSSRGCRGRQPR